MKLLHYKYRSSTSRKAPNSCMSKMVMWRLAGMDFRHWRFETNVCWAGTWPLA